MKTDTYGFARKLEGVNFETARERITAALKEQGFGVLTEIDVKATLKKKIDVDVDKYTILGACNPHFAHQALQLEKDLGLLLPCNVIVYEDGDDSIVNVIDPHAMFQVVDNPKMGAIADEVAKLLKTALANA